jgi:urease accessory protein
MDSPLTLTHRLSADAAVSVSNTLALTAEERTRSRHYFETATGQPLYLNLPRGTVLNHGDLLQATTGELVRITAKPEPVITVTAQTLLDLLRAAYHLGNRHVPLEVTATYLRLAPDPVLVTMLEQLGLNIHPEVAPFAPEVGAYGHRHPATHSHE